MPTGDPMLRCSVCGAVYYLYSGHACPVMQADPYTTTLYTNRTYQIPADDMEHTIEVIPDVKEEPVFKTLVVNLLGGPGSGKSSLCKELCGKLKWKGVLAETADEYAKDLVWEERHQTFDDQIYIFGKQYHRIFRLLGQVAVIITDSPILLTPIYDPEKREWLKKGVLKEHSKMWTYNIFLKRVKPYDKRGRNHDEKEARRIDKLVLDFLDDNNLPFEVFDGTEESTPLIRNKILLLLNHEEKDFKL